MARDEERPRPAAQRPGRIMKLLVISVACVYLGGITLVYFYQSRLIFQPTRELSASPADQGLAFQDVYLATDDGQRLHAWFVPHPAAAATVLFLHGNAGNIADRPLTLARLHELRLNVLMLDYRGYGASTGAPSETGTYLDADAAWRYLTGDRAERPQDIIIYGRSLGGAVAIELGARTRPRAVVVESSFASLAELAAEVYPYLPTRLLLRHEYPSIETIKRITAPILIAHSEDDELIPFRHGRALIDNAPAPKHFYRLRGSHNEAFVVAGEAYYRALGEFINAAGGSAAIDDK